MTLGFAYVAAVIYLAWLLERPRLLVAALAGSLVLLVGPLALGPRCGRCRLVEVDRARRLGAHLGRVALARRPALAGRDLARRGRVSGARRSSASRGSRPCSSGSCSLAGTYLALVRVPHLRDLWTQSYGQVLLVKISLVAAAVAWGAFHHFVVRPRLAAAGAGHADAGRAQPRRRERWSGSRCCSSRRSSSTRSRRRSRCPRFRSPRRRRIADAARGAGRRRPARSARPRGGGRRRPGPAACAASSREVVVGVRRLAQADVAERLGVEVVHRRRRLRRSSQESCRKSKASLRPCAASITAASTLVVARRSVRRPGPARAGRRGARRARSRRRRARAARARASA